MRYVLCFAPDSRSEFDTIVAEGDQVVAFLTWSGTHRLRLHSDGYRRSSSDRAYDPRVI